MVWIWLDMVASTQGMLVLERKRLFGNLKKYAFFTHEVSFLGYIVTRVA